MNKLAESGEVKERLRGEVKEKVGGGYKKAVIKWGGSLGPKCELGVTCKEGRAEKRGRVYGTMG